MDFLDSVMDVVDASAPVQDRSKKGIPWLKSFSFTNGDFPMRFVSDDTKCPKGFHPYCVHEVQTKPVPNAKLTKEEREKYFNKILCPLSTHGTVPYDTGRRDDKGNPILGAKLAEPCAVCDVFADIQQTFGEWEGDPGMSKFLGLPEEKISKGIQDALEDMRQGTCLIYLFPILVRCREVKNDKTGYDEYQEGNDLMMALLTLQPGKYSGDKTMLKQINDLRKGRPNFFSRESGNWCLYSRQKRNSSLVAEDPQPLNKNELELLKKMPEVTSYGKGREGVPGSNKTMSYDQAMYSFDDCWWMKSIKRAHPAYNTTEITPGLV